MPGNPIADDRGEFANLQRQATIVPRRHAQRIFVEPNLGAVIARVKAAIEPGEKIIDVECARRAGKGAQAKDAQLHATALTPSEAGKRTSNSVQSFSERTRHKSPPCSLASSRAKFKPIPWPDAADGVER